MQVFPPAVGRGLKRVLSPVATAGRSRRNRLTNARSGQLFIYLAQKTGVFHLYLRLWY